MRDRCRRAYVLCRESREKDVAGRAEVTKDFTERKAKAEEEEVARLKKISEEIKSRDNFYSARVMKSVYGNHKSNSKVAEAVPEKSGVKRKEKLLPSKSKKVEKA